MSQRNSRAAKAARRSKRATRHRYPDMPPGTCYGSSIILAACYPELRYAEGTRTWTRHDGRAVRLEHAWNVNTTTGEIWDSTLRPEARMVAGTRYGELVYTEGERTMPAGAFAGWCAVALEAIGGRAPEQQRQAIEAIGRVLLSVPADSERGRVPS